MALKCILHAQFICNDVDSMSVAAPLGWVVTRQQESKGKKKFEKMFEKKKKQNGRECWESNGTLVPPKSQS